MANRLEQVLEAEQRRAKKIDALVSLLRDPDLRDFVSKLTEESTHASQNGHKRSNGRGESIKPGQITPALRAAGPKMPNPFTIHDAVNVLMAEGFKFTRKPIDQVRDSLYFLVREDPAPYRVVEQGAAGRLSKYEYVGG